MRFEAFLVFLLALTLNIPTVGSFNECDFTSYTYNANYGNCIWIRYDKLNWFDARKQCQKEEGDLVMLDVYGKPGTFADDILWFARDDNLSSLWIGLKIEDQSNKWKWVDGHELTHPTSKWTSGAPHNVSEEYCGTFLQDGKWKDELCLSTDQLGRICEVSMIPRMCSFYNGDCQHICIPDSRHCYCYPGYELINETHCVVIDMCEEKRNPPSCQQNCESKNGTKAVCSCNAGYRLVGNISCTFDACYENNGGCSDVCENIKNESKALCLCSMKFKKLAEDGKTCEWSTDWILIFALTPVTIGVSSSFFFYVAWRKRNREPREVISNEAEIKQTTVIFKVEDEEEVEDEETEPQTFPLRHSTSL